MRTNDFYIGELTINISDQTLSGKFYRKGNAKYRESFGPVVCTQEGELGVKLNRWLSYSTNWSSEPMKEVLEEEKFALNKQTKITVIAPENDPKWAMARAMLNTVDKVEGNAVKRLTRMKEAFIQNLYPEPKPGAERSGVYKAKREYPEERIHSGVTDRLAILKFLYPEHFSAIEHMAVDQRIYGPLRMIPPVRSEQMGLHHAREALVAGVYSIVEGLSPDDTVKAAARQLLRELTTAVSPDR